jgi:hypothetical protein
MFPASAARGGMQPLWLAQIGTIGLRLDQCGFQLREFFPGIHSQAKINVISGALHG